MIGAAFTGYLIGLMPIWQTWLLGIGSLFFFAPALPTDGIGLVLILPILIIQFISWRNHRGIVATID